MIEWPIAVFLLSLVVIQEVWGSGKGFSEFAKIFWRYSQKAITPSRDWTALIFVTLSTLCFASWESLLRVMLQSEVGWWLAILGAVAVLIVMGRRAAVYRQRSHAAWPISSLEWTVVIVGFSLLIQAWFCAVLCGAWTYWRASKVLPKQSFEPRS